MGIVTRSTKPNTSTSWANGDVLSETGLNGDIDNIITEVNGSLDADNLANDSVTEAKLAANAVVNAKVAAAAAIETQKLAQDAAVHSDATRAGGSYTVGLDADAIQSHADDSGTFTTVTSPGDSSSITYPDELETELENIRFAIKRLALGSGAQLIDATNQAAWFDGAAIGPNLLRNGAFLDNATPPTGWTVNGAPATDEVLALPRAEGWGKYLHLLDAAGDVTDGIEQTLSGLKDSTLYLVEARLLDTTAEATLKTTGANAATYDDLDLDTDSSATWQTISGVIQTDAAGTDIVVKIEVTNANYDIGIAWVSVREISQSVNTAREGELVLMDETSTDPPVSPALSLSVIPPGDGYVIEVEAEGHGTAGGGAVGQFTLSILEGGVAKATVNFNAPLGLQESGSVRWVNTSPTPGTVYTYTVSTVTGGAGAAWTSAAPQLHRLFVRLKKI